MIASTGEMMIKDIARAKRERNSKMKIQKSCSSSSQQRDESVTMMPCSFVVARFK